MFTYIVMLNTQLDIKEFIFKPLFAISFNILKWILFYVFQNSIGRLPEAKEPESPLPQNLHDLCHLKQALARSYQEIPGKE